MGSRGRGRGRASMSISTEQLGFGKGEALPPPVLQPPAKYPLLDYKPTKLELTTDISYMLGLKRDFADFFRESQCNVQSIIVKKDIERYSDRYQDLVTAKEGYHTKYDWTRLPEELKPAERKRKVEKGKSTKTPASKNPKKKKKDVDVAKTLQELEQKENTQQSDVEEDDKGEEEGEEKDADDPVEEEEEEVDEEMDDGTDYVNNYFDNGEGYDDEEDNLDDGPIY